MNQVHFNANDKKIKYLTNYSLTIRQTIKPSKELTFEGFNALMYLFHLGNKGLHLLYKMLNIFHRFRDCFNGLLPFFHGQLLFRLFPLVNYNLVIPFMFPYPSACMRVLFHPIHKIWVFPSKVFEFPLVDVPHLLFY